MDSFKIFVSAVAVIAVFTLLAAADTRYRSRPDLSPPTLNITIPCHDNCSDGYLFVAPFTGYEDPVNHGPLQGAPYILTSTGDLVWSGFTYFSIWAGNFQAAKWKGKPVLFSFEGAHNSLHGHGHGHHTFLDQDYQNIRELRAGNHMISDKHEFIVLNETTALFQIYHPLQKNLALYGGTAEQTWIVDARFQEMNIETGEVLFEWASLEHVSPNETALPLPLGQAGIGHNSSTAWDYFHINSITKGDDGHYLLSARHASTIYKINGTDGSIIWQLGGHSSDFELGPNVTFGFQHHARYLQGGVGKSTEIISLFDNSVYGSESGGGGDKEVHLFPYSRGKYIKLDHEAHIATLELAFLPPQGPILAKSQGSLQTLPNRNVLINWGSEGQITEYSPSGEPIFHAYLDSGLLQDKLQNYRAFRYEWTGHSPETLAVFAEECEGGVIKVYVSWNGDTRTVVWKVFWAETTLYGETVQRSKTHVKTGFETTIQLPVVASRLGSIFVKALDADGQVLQASEGVRAELAYWLEPQGTPLVRPSYLGQQVMNEDL
ncbi:hypothetical protein FHETE_6977 [Fusarium heterosporum]|uniref:ASST-domain-containing protein n=1 Tax=Fusarium heterosporum TaxID=42747 RepID=A0A8H5T4X6_FUSHE|nr:hypothetical protein FHETE_6977 [Fusarium heterosporum]